MEPNPQYPVIIAKGGSAENLTPVSAIQIPDMWHLSIGLDNFGDAIAKLQGQDGEPDDAKLVALRDALIAIGHEHAWLADPANIKSSATFVMKTWGLAHDLKRNLSGEVKPMAGV